MDTDKIWEQGKTAGPYKYLTSICLDLANPGATPEGMCQFSITNLPLVQGFLDLKEEDYYDFKRKIANDMIDEYERVSGINLRDHIVEIEVSTPVTVAHYEPMPSAVTAWGRPLQTAAPPPRLSLTMLQRRRLPPKAAKRLKQKKLQLKAAKRTNRRT